MWDLIVLVPGHYLSFYFTKDTEKELREVMDKVVGLQYIDKKRSCQPDLVDAQNTDYLA